MSSGHFTPGHCQDIDGALWHEASSPVSAPRASDEAVQAVQAAWLAHQERPSDDPENNRTRICTCGQTFPLWSKWVDHRWQMVADAAIATDVPRARAEALEEAAEGLRLIRDREVMGKIIVTP